MRMYGSFLAIMFSAAVGCGDSGSAEPQGGSGGEATAGGGGAGGADPACEPGSHDDGTGTCVAALGEFADASPLAFARDHHMTWAVERSAGKFLFVAGGYKNMTTEVSSIERAQIAEDGSLGAWQTLTPEADTSGAIIGTSGNTVVLAGGYRGNGPSKVTEIATIDDSGAISDLTLAEPLNQSRFHGGGVQSHGFFYAVGGMDGSGTSLATLERASYQDGVLGAWTTLPVEMPEARSHQGVATNDESIYVTGGLSRINNDFANDASYDTVLRGVLAEDGSIGAFTQQTPLPLTLSIHSSFVHAGHLYVVGGLDVDASKFLKTIYRAPIGEDGDLAEWEEVSVQLPRARGHSHQTPVVDGVLYSVGGHLNGTSQDEVYFAKFE